jgi:hypothetical protein
MAFLDPKLVYKNNHSYIRGMARTKGIQLTTAAATHRQAIPFMRERHNSVVQANETIRLRWMQQDMHEFAQGLVELFYPAYRQSEAAVLALRSVSRLRSNAVKKWTRKLP